MAESGRLRKRFFQSGPWLSLIALAFQLGLPLVHFGLHDTGPHPSCVSQACNADAASPSAAGPGLQKAGAFAPESSHDHATCPICQSLQRLGAVELTASQTWTGPDLTGANNSPFRRVFFCPQPEWRASSPRGPPRIL